MSQGETQGLPRPRENIERCLTILTRCQTRYEVIEGLVQIATLLREVDDSLADAAGRAVGSCRLMSDELVLGERDYFISACRTLLSDTG